MSRPQTARWLRGLNEEQAAAVAHRGGPLLVLAGAGSGKTRVITHRIAALIDDGAAPEQLLAVTFTNKAAGEMRLRLQQMIGAPARGVTLATFHALGLLLLRAERERGGRSRPFTILDGADQLAVLRELLRHARLERGLDLQAILARISAFKNAFWLPSQVPARPDDEYHTAAASLYGRYQAQLEALAALDFDDLIVEPVRLLADPACRRRWTERFLHVLVDEYQDTNHAQLRLLLALAGERRQVCVVGDDDQSIYGWRGAEVRNILEFEKDFSGARRIYLMRNYRSVPEVLAVANAVIAGNKQRHAKQMTPDRRPGATVRLLVAPDGEAEARWIGQLLEEQLARRRYPARELAVLYRSTILARGLEAELRSRRIDYRVVGGTSLFERKEVKDLAAYLRLVVNPNDELSLRRVINYPARGIGPTTIARLSAWAEQRQVPLSRAVASATEVLPGDRVLPALDEFCAIIDETRSRVRRGGGGRGEERAVDRPVVPGAHRPGGELVAAVEHLIERIQLRQDLQQATASNESGKLFELRWGNVQGLLDALRGYCRSSQQPSLREFLGQLALNGQDADAEATEATASGSGQDGATPAKDTGQVTLSTLHGAKGLEFGLVVLVGLEEGLLPHDRTLNPQVTDIAGLDIAEERRLCYVGITRAKDELIMTRCSHRQLRGKLAPRAASRFLDDVPPAALAVEDLSAPPDADERARVMAELGAKLGW